ncbi:hisA/hisF family protein [Candidatus Methanoperedens nitroreducens]|uniref:HisA/hisF family protein n=1 Tax=Candidatus Methanoperedens nitratireducens TaxID=1392998 RepID=A0A062VB21_9EURY|nr:HisA/HisF-related TIM barrel protein [Candidatus Methanoperedens nitroreducens]KCZ72505.1 hisA/hisF family protein [Candidatus Methanoperedens nitroreducens]MDJ1423563.1 HisA/HisF-related TIM barrel protein [Candidatus Methanoperedens sp.]
MFRIVFVLDILNGNAVHAVKGERSKYQPVQSRVCSSSDPLDIVSSLKPKEVYIADLDRLQHTGDNFELIKEISMNTRTMVDTGVEKLSDVEIYVGIADTVILGTETASLELIDMAAKLFPGVINVSIDIKNGSVLTKDRNMVMKPQELVELLNGYDIENIIVLDLNKVGTGTGIDVDFLQDIVGLSAHSILVGGGIRGMDDIDALEEIGVGGALVATAVHSGNIHMELLQ